MSSTAQDVVSNPFALMMDPDAVFAALARSHRLERLQSRICRPLDKPFAPRTEATDATTLEELADGSDDFGA